MSWIILIKKLPTLPSPPKLSFHWSTAWPEPKWVEGQKKQMEDDYDEAATLFPALGGFEPNWARARKIHWAGEDLRVFPHEFNLLTADRMRFYLGENAYEFVAGDTATEQLRSEALDGETRPIFDAARLDGCDEMQALLVALGMDVSIPDAEFPPLGWYRCRPEIATVYCDDWEMSEDTKRYEAEPEPAAAPRHGPYTGSFDTMKPKRRRRR